jgi:Flp pilus assembly protein TadG
VTRIRNGSAAALRCPKAERGNALAEFALVLVAFVVMTFGIIDFGRAMFTYHTIGDAARVGSRWAIVRGSACALPGCPVDSSAVQTYLRSVTPGIDRTQLTATLVPLDSATCSGYGNQGPGCRIQVTVSYPFRFLVPLIANYPVTFSSQSTMVGSQ